MQSGPPAAADSLRVSGTVRGADGAPLAGASVLLLETLEGAVTGTDGRFAFVARGASTGSLVVRRVGYRELRRVITAATPTTALEIALVPAGRELRTMYVEAGRYTADAGRGATLTPLEVVTTPGTAADVNRALQLLPGVQQVDEGTGLFVRGGDHTETRVFVDGAPLASPVQLQRQAGTFVGSVDPFLLDGIYFSTGGFGVRFGDAMSAVADLRTQGRPTRSAATISAGLAAVSVTAALPLPHGTGLRVAGNRFDLTPLLRVNGSPRQYAPAPHGYDASGSAHWRYGAAGVLKVFAVRQTNGLGLEVADAGFAGTYATTGVSDLAVLRWEDAIGTVSPSVSLSRATLGSAEAYGAFVLDRHWRATRASAQLAWERSALVTVRGGVEAEHLVAPLDGTVPVAADDPGLGARTHVLRSRVRGTRSAYFIESDWRPMERLRVVSGLRSDRSTLTARTTLDPRVSVALGLRPTISLTAAWGIYHQLPDPLHFDPTLGLPDLPSQRATQAVLGVQVGDEEATSLRLEAYHKRYRELAQVTRDYEVTAHGIGRSRGVDVFATGPLALGVTGRVSYSLVDAELTDPHSGRTARAAFDVTHALNVVAERSWGTHWRTAVAWRAASGRPITPVDGADWDVARAVWTPRHGLPMSERLPRFGRVDVSASHLWLPRPTLRLVSFAGITNVSNRENVYAYRYAADYTTREPVRSIFNRALYVGASLSRF